MTAKRPRKSRPFDALADPAALTYLVVGLAACAVVALALMVRGAGLWAVLPPFVGAAGLAFGWVSAPVFVLLGVAIALLITQPLSAASSATADVILAGATVAYVMAQYRLCAVAAAIMPADPRRALGRPARPRGLPAWLEFLLAITVVPYLVLLLVRPKPAADPHAERPPRRDGASAGPDELPWALAAVAAAAIGAAILWHVTGRLRVPPGINARQWRLGVVLWCAVAPAAAAWAVVGYRGWRRLSPASARLALNEFFWKETRRETRRIARWTRWARLRDRLRINGDI
jgi:hypothetical protein